MTLASVLRERLAGAQRAIETLVAMLPQVEATCRAVLETLERGGTVYTAGNGGSAAQALHLAEEMIGRYRSDRAARAAVCLNADPTAITCIANDFGFDQIFARQCQALLNPIDTLIVLSTSGNSPNITEALKIARARPTRTIGLLGNDGGASRALCDHALVIPANDSAHVQEAHQVIIHLICEALEQPAER